MMKTLFTVVFLISSLARADSVMVVTDTDVTVGTTCWAEIYSEKSYGGEKLTLLGEQKINNLKFPKDWSAMNSIRSAKTGPTGTVRLYGDEYQSDLTFYLQRGAEFPLLQNVPEYDDIESVRLDCRDNPDLPSAG